MNRRLMKAGEKNYLKESNGTKANCNANVTQVRKSRIYSQGSNWFVVQEFTLIFSFILWKPQEFPEILYIRREILKFTLSNLLCVRIVG